MSLSSCPPQTGGLECSLVYIAMGLLALGAILFRKNVANDLLNTPFSMIGSIALGEISFFISIFGIAGHHLILKWALLVGIVAMLVGGFVCGDLFGDGNSSGGSQ